MYTCISRFSNRLVRGTFETLTERWLTNCAPLIADLFLFCYRRDCICLPGLKASILILFQQLTFTFWQSKRFQNVNARKVSYLRLNQANTNICKKLYFP